MTWQKTNLHDLKELSAEAGVKDTYPAFPAKNFLLKNIKVSAGFTTAYVYTQYGLQLPDNNLPQPLKDD